MIMKDQEIIDFIIKGLEESNKISFRNNDLLNTFITGKDISPTNIYHPSNLNKNDQKNYQRFKEMLIEHLSRHQMPFIQGPDDFLDIFSNKGTYEDYVRVYTLQNEIDILDTIASDQKNPEKERIIALERMYQLYNQERNILEKYGE